MKSIQILGNVFKTDGLVANSVDHDQTPRCVASDLGLHCLYMPVHTISAGLAVRILTEDTVQLFVCNNETRRLSDFQSSLIICTCKSFC